MKGTQIRKAFLDYFASKGHQILPSSSLIPEGDPTLLFSNAGMNQFKNLFLGSEKRSYTRATTSQKCMRISGKHNDLENVGVTARHHTFFEMLGNFSFGDYFKTEVIKYAWEFITEELKLDKQRLWVTVFEEDEDAKKIWENNTDVLPGRILKLGADDNFWAMGPTGPCGPCSEIHYYLGEDLANQSEAAFRLDTGEYLEIWNLVFMQFDRSADGVLSPLPKPSVDTGMGLERITAVMQNKKSNYDSDLLRPIISECERLSGFKYDGSSYEERNLKTDLQYARDVAMRVIADHSRAITFLIADGVQPSSEGRGYVLRRIIRRAVRHGKKLDFKENFLKHTSKIVIDLMGDLYPELSERSDMIARVLDAEEGKFHETLDSGLNILQKEAAKLKKGEDFPGTVAFQLHDTYGFPVDLTQDALKEYAINVDIAGFEAAMQEQQDRSRADRESRTIQFVSQSFDCAKTNFLGYQNLEVESTLLKIISDNDELALVFKDTPFYAESGGQVGDTGKIIFKNLELEVLDTQKVNNEFFVHRVKLLAGDLSPKLIGEKAFLKVDPDRRSAIAAHHSATHVVHAALRKFLGKHVKQAGSRVDANSLRFDYSHFESMSPESVSEIFDFANSYIRSDYPVEIQELPIEQARKLGAMALFGEKYGDIVRVVTMGPDSIEFCGGTHVKRTGELGLLLFDSDSSISSGTRRIECKAAASANVEVSAQMQLINSISGLLNCDSKNILDKLHKSQSERKNLEKEIAELQSKLARLKISELLDKVKLSASGTKILAEVVSGIDASALREVVDELKLRMTSGLVALFAPSADTANLVIGVSSDLKALNAGNIVKQLATEFGAKGGGRPDFAQAGGFKTAELSRVLERIYSIVP